MIGRLSEGWIFLTYEKSTYLGRTYQPIVELEVTGALVCTSLAAKVEFLAFFFRGRPQ